jgi:hypothetical protein
VGADQVLRWVLYGEVGPERLAIRPLLFEPWVAAPRSSVVGTLCRSVSSALRLGLEHDGPNVRVLPARNSSPNVSMTGSDCALLRKS